MLSELLQSDGEGAESIEQRSTLLAAKEVVDGICRGAGILGGSKDVIHFDEMFVLKTG